MLIWIVFGRPLAMKNGVNCGDRLTIGDANAKTVLKMKMPYFPD